MTTTVRLPDPVVRSRHPSAVADLDALARDLSAEVDGEVRFDAGSRAAYSTDASNYREIPIAVVVPRTVEAGADTIAVCRRHGAPVLSRGGDVETLDGGHDGYASVDSKPRRRERESSRVCWTTTGSSLTMTDE